MQYIFSILLFSLIMLSSCFSNPMSQQLARVDDAIKDVDQKQATAIQFLDSLILDAEFERDPHVKVAKYIQISDKYNSLDLEKSMEYLLKARRINEDKYRDQSDSLLILMKFASIFNSEGLMVKEASDIFEAIVTQKLDSSLLLKYYILGVQVNKSLEDRAFEASLKKRYASEAARFRDSVLKIDPSNAIIAANKLLEMGEDMAALNLVKKVLPNSKKGERTGPYYHYLSRLYGQVNMPDSQIYYLALAAEDDLNHGVREYIALRELAEQIEDTDPQRAITYIEQSHKDAIGSHSDLRRREVEPAYHRIRNTYNQSQKRLVSIVIAISIALVVVLIILISVGVMLRKKNKSLSDNKVELEKYGEELKEMNQKLENANVALARESKTKSVYINSFMGLCLDYLDKMEKFRAKLGNIASKGDLRKVVEAINSSRYVNQEAAEFFENFDKAFLSIYPDFIEKLNSLLQEEYQYAGSQKLNTEIRIYALIWLGITSSMEIAKFLRCSESTVYNYRSQMRNRALNRNDFETEWQNLAKENL